MSQKKRFLFFAAYPINGSLRIPPPPLLMIGLGNPWSGAGFSAAGGASPERVRANRRACFVPPRSALAGGHDRGSGPGVERERAPGVGSFGVRGGVTSGASRPEKDCPHPPRTGGLRTGISRVGLARGQPPFSRAEKKCCPGYTMTCGRVVSRIGQSARVERTQQTSPRAT